ncbi:hypothetical protein HCA58_13135 [Micromonospora sp. HNM0581]|uniref:hypothetical protein n=1 Tax=Micromonospora sp. HNM0581 TaxID=2716341 RepID=UPI00146F76F5|nr:hypothetical protein [Micromonospora sp. HNM0581]NLU79306.1 hypothetical protein [Micromonospora sp. HNM0581]
MPGPPPDLVEQLYRTPPDRFVAARDAAVAQARSAGEPGTAREIARLRRPTVAAWLVNLLALERPELVSELAQLAEALREAQRELRGPRLRELSAQRRAVVGALVGEVRRLAADVEGAPSGGKLPLAEVEATLNAALSDVEVAEQVRSGRLLRPAHYAGFGEVPRPQLRLVTGDEEPPPGEPTRQRPTGSGALRAEQAQRAARAERSRRRRALATELHRARTDQERAETELAGAVATERDGTVALDAVEAELAELERRRDVAEQELSRSRLARRAAERAVSLARRRAGEVEAAMEAFDAEEGDADAARRPAD